MHYDISCARSSKELENTDEISDKETAKPLPIHCIISGAQGNFSRVSHCKKGNKMCSSTHLIYFSYEFISI